MTAFFKNIHQEENHSQTIGKPNNLIEKSMGARKTKT